MPGVQGRGPLGAVLAIALVPGGALAAVPAVILHQSWWGLVLGLAVLVGLLVALPAGWLRVGFAAGWAVGVGVLSMTRPEGDYLVASTLPGYALLVAAVAVVVVALVTIPARPRPGEGATSGDDPGSAVSGT